MYERKRLSPLLILSLLSCVGALVFMLRDISDASDPPAAEKRYTIEVVLKTRANPPDFWRIVEQGVSMAAEEFMVNCTVTGPTRESDVESQIELVNQAFARRPDAIILAPGDYTRLVPACEAIVEAGIPVIIVDSDLDTQKRMSFVGTDNYELGRKMAALVDSLIGPDERFGVIGHMENTSTAIQRGQGLLENVRDSESRLAALAYCDSYVEVARQQTKSMLEEYPGIQCFVGLNESSALGIAQAITELGLSGKIMVVACDSSEQQIQSMENGTIQAFVIQNPYNMGYLSMKTAVEVLEGKKVEKFINTGSIVITKEEMYKPENQKLLFPFTET